MNLFIASYRFKKPLTVYGHLAVYADLAVSSTYHYLCALSLVSGMDY